MKGREHLVFGITSSATAMMMLMPSCETIEKAIFVGSAALGSLLPDVDTDTPLSKEILLPIRKIFEVLKIPHRTLTHDILLWGLIFLGSLYTKNLIFMGIMFGYLGHLLLDSMTKSGLCFGYFFRIRRPIMVHLLPKKMRILSSGTAAVVITYLLCIGLLFLLYRNMGGLG